MTILEICQKTKNFENVKAVDSVNNLPAYLQNQATLMLESDNLYIIGEKLMSETGLRLRLLAQTIDNIVDDSLDDMTEEELTFHHETVSISLGVIAGLAGLDSLDEVDSEDCNEE